MSRFLFSFFVFLACHAVRAQDQVRLDSLLYQLQGQGEDTLKIKTLLAISSYYSNHDYQRAVEFGQKARDLSLKTGVKKFEAMSDRMLAYVFLGMGDYKMSSTHYFKALKFYEDHLDTVGMLSINNNLGAVYDRLHEFDKALSYYFKAQSLLNHLRPDQQIKLQLPVIFNNIANIYQSKGDIPSALQYYEKALQLAGETNNKSLQGTASNNLGKLYLNDLHQYDKAITYLNKGLAIRQERGDLGEIAKSYNIIADYYLQTKNYVKAREAVDQTIHLGKQIGSLETQKSGYLALSRIEEAVGKYPHALESFKMFKDLNDSIQNQQANSEITRLQLQYDFEKADLLHDQQAKQSRLRYIATIIILAAGLILAILITIIVRTRARQTELKRKNLAQDVEIKNKELTTNVMYLIRKNELINNVAERLLKLQNNLLSGNHKIIQEIILDLQKEADHDTWKEFELRFHQVHSGFYSKLRSQYPLLSPADEKLCAFLKLNMSSKEIAAITQQSIKSVEVARARLRKKLNLTNTTSNLVTHLSNL